MTRRFTFILEDDVYDELVAKSELLSVSVSELLRRGADRILGRDGYPAGVWRRPDDFEPRRAGVKFKR